MEARMFFDGWMDIGRTVLVGALAYFALVALLRISGKRTLAKMNAFDLVVTVALGSTLATILLSRDVALAEGIAAFLTLIGLQYLIAWLSVRSPGFQGLIKSEPRMLLFEGRFRESEMRAERVTREEVIAAIRAQGIARNEDVVAVVLETDGTFAALHRADGPHSALRTVSNTSHLDLPDEGAPGVEALRYEIE
jgi:uncharacterized membrane protein YcaP (DUF421 family)